MCSISGVVLFKNINYGSVDNSIKEIIQKGTDRGRDSYGIITFEKI